MKRAIILLATIFCITNLQSQDITGKWNGILKVQGMQLTIVFNIEKNESEYFSTMDSPDQGAFGIKVDKTSFSDNTLRLSIPSAGIEYSGEFLGDKILGTFKQFSFETELNLTKDIIEVQKPNRPQEPQPPFPYISEDVYFKNTKDNITLAGTLTIPGDKGNYPAVVLITGSGPQNRDEEVFGHKPFLVISDYLTRNGIAVLRFDDRGVAKSEGNFSDATSYDFATDAKSAVDYLKTRKEINKNNIGLVGHSEGGIIAPIVASKYPNDISFIVLLAGTGLRGDNILLMQQELIGRAMGMPEDVILRNKEINQKAFEMVINSSDIDALRNEMLEYVMNNIKNDPSQVPQGMPAEDFAEMQVNQVTTTWMVNFIKLDPAVYLEKVKCRVLAVNGELDLQVPADANLFAIKNALKKGGNENVTIIAYPNLNHLFQRCTSGLPDKYIEIEETFSVDVLKDLANWILKK
ncbi:MAG: alpha/beta fold hydrolase [Bacteroidetes bacterium]|nr:alpha/beta fold hydrolase [Bacteroidota bacterium]